MMPIAKNSKRGNVKLTGAEDLLAYWNFLTSNCGLRDNFVPGVTSRSSRELGPMKRHLLNTKHNKTYRQTPGASQVVIQLMEIRIIFVKKSLNCLWQ